MTASKEKLKSKGQTYTHAYTHTLSREKLKSGQTYIQATTHTLSAPPTKRSRHLAWLDHLCPSPPRVVLVYFALRISSKTGCFVLSANILKIKHCLFILSANIFSGTMEQLVCVSVLLFSAFRFMFGFPHIQYSVCFLYSIIYVQSVF